MQLMGEDLGSSQSAAANAEIKHFNHSAKKCLDLALPKTFPSETQPSVEVIDCQG